MKNRAVGPALFHADGETGKYTGRQVGKRAGGHPKAVVRECLKLVLPDFAAGCASYNSFTSTIILKFC